MKPLIRRPNDPITRSCGARSRIRFLVLLIAVLGGLNGLVFAQHIDSFFAQTPFALWASQAPQQQVPWTTHVLPLDLTLDQRLGAYVSIVIERRYFKQRSGSGDLVALVEFTDASARQYQEHSVLRVDNGDRRLRDGVYFRWKVLLLPGNYSVAMAFYDKATGKYSFSRHNLRINPLSKDPLPDAWRDLPALEFLPLNQTMPDGYFNPQVKSRLHLPLVARRPVRIELLANLTGTGRAMVSHNAYNFNLGVLLPILKSFSQVEVQGGALNLETMDLVRRKVAFRQENIGDLAWPRLKEVVASADPTTVDVHALEDVKHTAAFLRNEVARRIESGAGPPDAVPVLVLISASAFFDSLQDINDTLLPKDCSCMVYYVRYSPYTLRFGFPTADFDNIRKVLRPLPIRARVAQSPLDLRRIMAEIMDDVSKL